MIVAERTFVLGPTADSAKALLGLLPSTPKEQAHVQELGDFLCRDESLGDVKLLAKVRDSLPADWARAVVIVPGKMQAYIAFAFMAVQDPSSDYVVQMQAACRKRHQAFTDAVGILSPHKRTWFTKNIMNPVTCRPGKYGLPEAY